VYQTCCCRLTLRYILTEHTTKTKPGTLCAVWSQLADLRTSLLCETPNSFDLRYDIVLPSREYRTYRGSGDLPQGKRGRELVNENDLVKRRKKNNSMLQKGKERSIPGSEHSYLISTRNSCNQLNKGLSAVKSNLGRQNRDT
jgi:hypothetical protein